MYLTPHVHHAYAACAGARNGTPPYPAAEKHRNPIVRFSLHPVKTEKHGNNVRVWQ